MNALGDDYRALAKKTLRGVCSLICIHSAATTLHCVSPCRHNCLSLNGFHVTLHSETLFSTARCVWVSVMVTSVSLAGEVGEGDGVTGVADGGASASLAGEVDEGDDVTGGKEPGVIRRRDW